jgi:phytoene dehydrogenase-like protein
MTRHKIIIIGGGISGLSALNRLLEEGIEDVLLLEAENRLGGRIQTKEYGEFIFKLLTLTEN